MVASFPGSTDRSFSLVSQPRLGPKRLGPGWTSSSRVSCASSCMTKYDNCLSFLYNSTTGLCTPGSSFDHQQQLPIPDEGNLYNSISCSLAGFQMYARGTETACVALFGSGSYVFSDSKCRSVGAVLLSVRTFDKMGILLQASGPGDSWIGCDDLDNDGVFTWTEDSGVLSEDEISLLFLSEPKSGQCVNFDKIYGRLASSDCSLVTSFLCEIPLP